MVHKNNILILFFISVIGWLILTFSLFNQELFAFSIICGIITSIIFSLFLIYMFNNRTFITRYEYELNKKMKINKNVLIESSNLPLINNKKIILLKDYNGLIETNKYKKKPIYYKKEIESCIFMLIEDQEVYIYIDKLNSKSTSEYENKLNRLLKEKEISNDILDDLSKTTILKIGKDKKYRVSPVKEEK